MKMLTILKTHNSFFVIAVSIILALTGCSSTNKAADKKLTEEDFTLTYKDKAQANGDIGKLILQHPLSISEQQIVFHMVALSYEPFSLFGKASSVFTKEDIQKTKRLLTKALNKAHSQNIITFEVESAKGSTKGELFASNGNLHWRFFMIQGVSYSLTRNQMSRYGTAWQMTPKEGQKYHITDKLLGSKQWTNWIEAKIDLPAPENLKMARPKKNPPRSSAVQSIPPPSQPSPPKPTPSGKNIADLEKKLQFLKQLHEKQLIDQQEYEKKRKDLLDQYL
ncbi:MAG: SHOCT domain-containing protein [Nitrospinota bacterium]|jgi:hypothetical protein|nr:SHOCT domain-containing protein [Nitrospinota bacterium]